MLILSVRERIVSLTFCYTLWCCRVIATSWQCTIIKVGTAWNAVWTTTLEYNEFHAIALRFKQDYSNSRVANYQTAVTLTSLH